MGAQTTRAVESTPRFDRAYEKKSAAQQDKLDETLERLRNNPAHPSLRVKRVRGTRSGEVWEASINMRRRLTFEYADDGESIVLRNCNGHEVLSSP